MVLPQKWRKFFTDIFLHTSFDIDFFNKVSRYGGFFPFSFLTYVVSYLEKKQHNLVLF